MLSSSLMAVSGGMFAGMVITIITRSSPSSSSWYSTEYPRAADFCVTAKAEADVRASTTICRLSTTSPASASIWPAGGGPGWNISHATRLSMTPARADHRRGILVIKSRHFPGKTT
jgi:hypothetical protein